MWNQRVVASYLNLQASTSQQYVSSTEPREQQQPLSYPWVVHVKKENTSQPNSLAEIGGMLMMGEQYICRRYL